MGGDGHGPAAAAASAGGGGHHPHGGDHHHHHAPKWIPPDWRAYKVSEVPKAQAHVQRLAAVGLKDPWVRNELWRYHPEFYRTPLAWFGWMVTRGAPLGFTAFFCYYAYDKIIGAKLRRKAEHQHHEQHEQSHHGGGHH